MRTFESFIANGMKVNKISACWFLKLSILSMENMARGNALPAKLVSKNCRQPSWSSSSILTIDCSEVEYIPVNLKNSLVIKELGFVTTLGWIGSY